MKIKDKKAKKDKSTDESREDVKHSAPSPAEACEEADSLPADSTDNTGGEFVFDTPVFDADVCTPDGDGGAAEVAPDTVSEGEEAADGSETAADGDGGAAEVAPDTLSDCEAVADGLEIAADGDGGAAEVAPDTASDGEEVAEGSETAADGDGGAAEVAPDTASDGEAAADGLEIAADGDGGAAEVAPDTDSDGEEVVMHEDIELSEAIEAEETEAAAFGEGADGEVLGTDGKKEPEDKGGDGENQWKDTDRPKRKKREDGSRRVDGIFDFIELFVFTLAVVLLLTSFVVRHSVVEGDSMLGTLHSGETLIISDLFYEPKVGDIVVVDDHSTVLKKPIIKRVIALGGDTVRVTKAGIEVNGKPLDEPYVYTDGLEYVYTVYPSEAYLDNETLTVVAGVYYEFVVPEGELFVLGDHRNKSTDSRDIGTVDADAVIGRVLFRVLPFDVFGKV